MKKKTPGGFSALSSGLKSALQWRLLLWWPLALAIPTALLALPLWSGLQAQFGHSVHAADVASGRNPMLLIDGWNAMAEKSASATHAGGLFAALLALLLSPWLAGMVVASLRAGRKLKLGELAHGGLTEYWRMFRLLLWSIVPLGIAIGLGSVATHAAGEHAEKAILASDAHRAGNIALAVLAVLFVFAHATIEAARGWFGADAGLRSIFRAWWRGLKLVLRRPLASLVVYVGASVAGYAFAALFALWRVHADGAGFGRFLLGLLLAQLVAAALAWGKIARLYGFAALAKGRFDGKAAAAEPAPASDAGDAAASGEDGIATEAAPAR